LTVIYTHLKCVKAHSSVIGLKALAMTFKALRWNHMYEKWLISWSSLNSTYW